MAADLITQFLNEGYVQQDDDGYFHIPGADGAKKFKPFS